MTAVLPSEADRFADRARAAALAGEVDTAEALFRQALEAEPGHVPAGTGLGELLIAGGDSEGALVVLAKLARTPEVERLEAAARVAGAHGGDLDSLRRRTGDHQARLDLGHALASQGDYAGALETLLEVVADRGELKDEARRAMLDIFEVLGANDPLAADYRRRLANALF
jgi:putative thioredoxin